MADGPELRVLEYSQDQARPNPKRRRVMYCIGLPLLAFGLTHGIRGYELDGLIAAVGALLVAMALPVRD